MRIFGYVRVSTPTQKIERQIYNIKNLYPSAVIFAEAYTGTTMARTEWEKLVSPKHIKKGDIIVFDSVSRMARNADEGFSAYEKLYNDGVELEFIKEPHINTKVYRQALTNTIPMTGTTVDLILEGVNKFLLELAKQQIRLAFKQAEKEVTDLQKRTKEGIARAHANGKQSGHPVGKKLNVKKEAPAKELIKKHSKMFGGSLNDAEVIKLTGLARNTYYKYKKELIEEQ